MPALSIAQLDIRPGQSVGPFTLGDSLWQTLEYLRTHKAEFPKIQIGWNVDCPASSAITVHVLPHIILTFPPSTSQPSTSNPDHPTPTLQTLQHIRLIHVPSGLSSGRLSLRYKGSSLSTTFNANAIPSSSSIASSPNAGPSSGTSATKGETPGSGQGKLTSGVVAKNFGPTWSPPVHGGAPQRLTYRGISYGLQGEDGRAHGSGRDTLVGDLAVYNHTWYEVNEGKDLGMEDRLGDGLLEGKEVAVMDGMVGAVRLCEIIPGEGITLHFHHHPTSPVPSLSITLHSTTAQDLLLDLGPPLRKYWKEDNRLAEVWGGGGGAAAGARVANGDDVEEGEAGAEGCWWNYFQHGVDFLIDDGGSEDGGTVVKVLVHSNVPGTALFQRYARCPWVLASPDGRGFTSTDPLEEMILHLKWAIDSEEDEGELKTMTLDRTIEGGLDGVVGIGPSRLAAIKGLVLEEAEHGGITSALVF